jgi:ATP-dependent Lhr-like helicase
MRSDDLLAAAFPDQAACQENVTRPIKIPDQPLVTETMRNCLYEAMDLKGLTRLLEKIQKREVVLLAKDTPTPSPLTHEILNSNPYTYLDDAPLEERRARAVATRRTLSEDDLRAFGALDAEAIASVASEIQPDVRSEDELADTLRELVLMPEASLPRSWDDWKKSLIASGRALVIGAHIVSFDRKDIAEKALNGDEEAAAQALRHWMMAGGPLTAAEWAEKMGLDEKTIDRALLRLESVGTTLRGKFHQSAIDRGVDEWCDRDVLARIHRRCLGQLRKSMEPATTVEFLRYLLRWQHVAPGTQVYGAHGLAEVIGQLQGLQLPAAAWEKDVFPARVADYHPSLLDELCLHGTVVWGRLIAGKDEDVQDPKSKVQRRQTPHRNTTISIMLREDLNWLLSVTRPKEAAVAELGEAARFLLDLLETRGAMFFNDLQALTGRLRTDLDQALWELVAAGMITCDGFAGLRNLANPSRRREKMRLLARYPGSRGPMFMGPGGRWSLLRPEGPGERPTVGAFEESPEEIQLANQYLRRWGVVFRDLLSREPAAPPWRVLLGIYRRLEARGEIRGGRFVSGFSGEQFALPEAVEALRSARREDARDAAARIEISATDPLNVTGYVTPAPRTPAILGNRVAFVGGNPSG